MSATATLHPDEKYKAGKSGRSLFTGGVAAFAVLTLISVLLARSGASHYTDEVLKQFPDKTNASGMPRFFYAYITGWAWVLSIALGALLFVLIHHVVNAKWSVTTRRLAEIITGTLPIIFLAGFVFLIPLLAGNKDIYYWAHPDSHLPGGKATWLSPAFFTARYVFFFAIWIAISRFFARLSREQDESGDPAISARLRRWSAPMIIVYALTVCYAGFDFLMSLAPNWFSTIYSVNFFGGSMMAGYATISLFAWALQRSGKLTRSVTTEHYHDLGKMVFAFTFFWTYTAFSQFMLIWYANVSEETVFYNYRMFSGWAGVSWVLLFCQFVIPFTLLLSRWTKRIMGVYVAVCLWQLTFHWLDLYWNVMPNYHWGAEAHGSALAIKGPLTGPVGDNLLSFNFADVTTWLGLVALFIAAIGRGMKGNLIPVKDPNLGASLGHENY